MTCSTDRPRITIEVLGADLVVSYPEAQAQTQQTPNTESATVLVDDVLAEGPSTAFCG